MRFAVLAALPLLALSHPAEACVPVDDEITPHMVDPAYANDTTPPPAPTGDYQVSRGESGGGCGMTDCDGKYANIYVDIAASDDQTPPERMGYILTIAGGDVPHDLYQRFADGAPVFQPRGEFSYNFDYDDTDWGFDLEVRAIDLNGNISAPTILHLDYHEGGCSVTSPSRGEWAVLMALGWIVKSRRRRVGSRSS